MPKINHDPPPRYDLEAVKRDFPLVDRIEADLGEPKAQKKHPTHRKWLCPFHGDKDTPSLSVDLKKHVFHCFGCGASGSVIDWEMQRADLKDPHEAADRITGGNVAYHWNTNPDAPRVNLRRQRRRAEAVARITGPPPPAAPTAEELEKRPPESEQERYAKHFPGSAAARYLEGRGIPPAVAQAHGCGYAPDLYGRPRVVFPYRDRAGALVALSGRAVVDCPPGERQRHKGPKRHGVFNPAALAEDTCIITEAPIDALSLIVCGYPAVALGGTSAPDWLSAARVGGTTWLGTDADPPQADGSPGPGDEAAARLDSQLRYTRCPRLRPPAPHKDWNAALCAMGRDALTAWLAEAMGPPPAAQDVQKCPHPHPREETPPATAAPRRVYAATTFGRVTEEPCDTPGYRLYYSDLLQEPFMVADVDRPEDAEPEPFVVVYTRREVALMKDLAPEDVKAIHELKYEWGGRYTGPAVPWPVEAQREAETLSMGI